MPTVHQDQQETAGTTLTFTVPGAADTGGYAIVEITCDNPNSAVPTPGQAGWTEAFSNTAAVDHRSSFFVRYIDATPPANWTFTVEANSGGRLVVVMPEAGETFSAADYAGTDNVSNVTSSTTGTGVANVADPRIFLGFWTQDSAATAATPPSGMTEVGTVHGSSGSSTSGACYYEEDPADVGDITRTLVWSVQDTCVAFGALVSFTAGGGPVTETVVLDPIEITLDVGGTVGIAVELTPIAIDLQPQGVTANGSATQTVTLTPIAIVLSARTMTVEVVAVPIEATGSRASISMGISL